MYLLCFKGASWLISVKKKFRRLLNYNNGIFANIFFGEFPKLLISYVLNSYLPKTSNWAMFGLGKNLFLIVRLDVYC